jgi:membrane-associated phospholipid phosphatase
MNNWLKIIIISALIWLLCFGIKEIVKQPRPEGATAEGYGFPSQHAAVAFGVVALIGANWITLGIASLICLQRIMSNNHTLMQVIVGALIGYFTALWLNKKIGGKL